MLEAELITFGLSPREAKVYLTTLKIGEAPASTIAKRCDLPRLSAYSILERLRELNFITCYQKRRVRIYRASDPEVFLNHCDDQILTLRSKKHRFHSLIPEFRGLSRASHEVSPGRLRVIRDRELFFQLCVKTLRSASEWHAIHDGTMHRFLKPLFRETRVPLRLLLPVSQQSRISKEMGPFEVHLLPDSHLKGPINFMLIQDKALFVLEDDASFVAVEVDHLSVVQMLRVFFLLLWNTDLFQV